MTERVKFEAWLFGEHTLPNQSIPYAAEEVMFELWQKLQACAEQKDKDIAELRGNFDGLNNVLHGAQKKVIELREKLARQPAYTKPFPQQKPLSANEAYDLWNTIPVGHTRLMVADFVREIEAAHGITGEKNERG